MRDRKTLAREGARAARALALGAMLGAVLAVAASLRRGAGSEELRLG